MKDKQTENRDTEPWKEELLQEGRTETGETTVFEKVEQRDPNRSLDEEAAAEQQAKEAATERD